MSAHINERFVTALTAIRDQVNTLLRNHERKYDNGEACTSARVTVAANLLHGIGLRSDNAEFQFYILEAMKVIEADCPCCNEERGDT